MPTLTSIRPYGLIVVHIEKGCARISTLSIARRSQAAPSFAAFSMVGRSGPRKRAVPSNGSANPVRLATRKISTLGGQVFEPNARRLCDAA